MDSVEIVKFIKTTLTREGEGKEGDPIRVITQYWDFEGNLMFEFDPHLGRVVSYNCTKLP
jgi:hypothetical protein